MKVVINKCYYGGFSLSKEAFARYQELGGLYEYDRDIPRDDQKLIQVVEELGELANSRFAELHIIEIPDDIRWSIEEYDGYEHIVEEHRTWS